VQANNLAAFEGSGGPFVPAALASARTSSFSEISPSGLLRIAKGKKKDSVKDTAKV
jgi:hypothetical protein